MQEVPVPYCLACATTTPKRHLVFQLKDDGVTDIVGVVLAAYRSLPSWNYYLRSTAEAFHAVGGRPV